MWNFLALTKKLQQNILRVICDKGIFRLLLNILLLGEFHITKWVLHYIGKHIRGLGYNETLLELKGFESLLAGPNYATALDGIWIL